MSSQVDIEVKAQVDAALANLNKIKSSLGGVGEAGKKAGAGTETVGGGLKNIAGQIGLAMTAVAAARTAVKFIGDSTSEFIAYGKQVGDFMRVTGNSAEDASKLIQVADDVQVSAEEMATALEAAVKKGVDPSIENLKKLSDEYLTLNEGYERSKFLTDKFGRSGMVLARVMELGSAGIEENSAAIADNLIMTDAEIEKSTELYNLKDTISDQWQGFKQDVGGAAGSLAMWLNLENKAIALLQEQTGSNQTMFTVQDMTEAKRQIKSMEAESGRWAAMAAAAAGATDDTTESTYNEETALSLVATTINGKVGPALENYRDQMEQIRNTEGAASENIGKLNESFSDYAGTLVYNSVAAGMSAQEQLELGRTLGIVDEATYAVQSTALGIADAYKDDAEGATVAAAAMQEAITTVAASGEAVTVENLAEAIDMIGGVGASITELPTGKTITITVDVVGNGAGHFLSGGAGAAAAGNYGHYYGGYYFGAARGLEFDVPAGYPGDSYLMPPTLLSSGEHVSVTPAGGSGGKGDVNIEKGAININAGAMNFALLARELGRQIVKESSR